MKLIDVDVVEDKSTQSIRRSCVLLMCKCSDTMRDGYRNVSKRMQQEKSSYFEPNKQVNRSHLLRCRTF